jgi:DNA (cytosine-5)-methyltransferase 1
MAADSVVNMSGLEEKAVHHFISLFSGAGGLDLGLEEAGWVCRYASDVDKAAVASLQANQGYTLRNGKRAFGDSFIERGDIRELRSQEVLGKAGMKRGDVALLAGGPPCQAWSSAGHQLGFNDPRGELIRDYVRIASEIDARWLLFENVRGLLTARGPDGLPGSALRLVRESLLRAGFQTAVGLLNAADYGVAQRRVRLFMIGYRRGDEPGFPSPTHAKESSGYDPRALPWVTLGEAVSRIDHLQPDEIIRPNESLAAQLQPLRPGTGVKSPGKKESTRPGGHWGYKQGAFVADLQQSARTVTASSQQDWIKDPIHGLRRLCPRECAAVQSFPPDWCFSGAFTSQYKQIGNAVPPLLAEALGGELLRQLDGERVAADWSAHSLSPLPKQLESAIQYTIREERANGASRKAVPPKRRLIAASRATGVR